MKTTMRFSKSQFEQAIQEALDNLPSALREKMENLEILLEEWPSVELRHEMRMGSRYDLLGLYQGVPHHLRDSHYNLTLPDTITLFQGPIEDLCRNEKDLKDEIRDVLYHEIGHYYGLSEEELAALEGDDPRLASGKRG